MSGLWLPYFIHHDLIACLTMSYPRSGAKVPLALFLLKLQNQVYFFKAAMTCCGGFFYRQIKANKATAVLKCDDDKIEP